MSDHGIGRYEGLTSDPGRQTGAARLRRDQLCRWRQALCPRRKSRSPVALRLGLRRRERSTSLGGEAWQRRKSRMKERIREIAGELIATAAERALRPADVMERDSVSGYRKLRRSLPVSKKPTIRTARSTTTLEDLSAGKPMDRLIVGDVGFGKTEIALRAAFVAAMAGQSGRRGVPNDPARPPAFPEFRRAFRGLSAAISGACRGWSPPAEAKTTREGLAAGTIDIVIGTHAILVQIGMEFKRLGLVVVDEEQRFGVTHKERLKALQVLTSMSSPLPPRRSRARCRWR